MIAFAGIVAAVVAAFIAAVSRAHRGRPASRARLVALAPVGGRLAATTPVVALVAFLAFRLPLTRALIGTPSGRRRPAVTASAG